MKKSTKSRFLFQPTKTETARKRQGVIQENDRTCKSPVQGLYDELLSIFIDEIGAWFSNDSCQPAIELKLLDLNRLRENWTLEN